MNRFTMSLLGLLLGIATAAAISAEPEKGSHAETAKLKWDFTPDPKLPNVLILGDSISIGYTLEVRALLKGKANVFRPMSGKGAENCLGTTKGVESIDRWIGDRKWAVIHFNFGLHDLKHVTEPGVGKNSNDPKDPPQATVEKYSENLAAIVGKLKATGARLVFATTTPVAPGTDVPFRSPDDPTRYNEAALKIMKANGIAIDDLFAFCQPQLAKIQLPKNVHFTDAGYHAMAAEVAKSIETELSRVNAGK